MLFASQNYRNSSIFILGYRLSLYKLTVDIIAAVVNEKCSKDVTLDKQIIQTSPLYFNDDDHSEDKVSNPSKEGKKKDVGGRMNVISVKGLIVTESDNAYEGGPLADYYYSNPAITLGADVARALSLDTGKAYKEVKRLEKMGGEGMPILQVAEESCKKKFKFSDGVVLCWIEDLFYKVAFVKARKGFICQAMETDSPVVPVLAFGQSYAYKWWKPRDQRVRDNWALIHAVDKAKKRDVPVAVAFNLFGQFLGAKARQLGFMIRGLKELSYEIEHTLHIPFFFFQNASLRAEVGRLRSDNEQPLA
ncbi:deoxyribodipyrimidine photo-lyase [Tanacetum coccineum]